MSSFSIMCSSEDTELYDEISDWLEYNIERYSFRERDIFGLSSNSSTLAYRYDVFVSIPDDTDAVKFKLRFSEEIESSAQYHSGLTASTISANITKALGLGNNQTTVQSSLTAAEVRAAFDCMDYGRHGLQEVYHTGLYSPCMASEDVEKEPFKWSVPYDLTVRLHNSCFGTTFRGC